MKEASECGDKKYTDPALAYIETIKAWPKTFKGNEKTEKMVSFSDALLEAGYEWKCEDDEDGVGVEEDDLEHHLDNLEDDELEAVNGLMEMDS